MTTDLSAFETFINSIPADNDTIEGEFTAEPNIPTPDQAIAAWRDKHLPKSTPRPSAPIIALPAPAYLRRKPRKVQLNNDSWRAMVGLALFVAFILLLCIWVFVSLGGFG